jgi:HEAT repeat protein
VPAGPDPEKLKKELETALRGLTSKDENVLSNAIETLRMKKAVEGVPALNALLLNVKVDSFTRMSAAAALGDIGSPDAVDSLIEAFVDEDFGVAQQAAKSVFKLTGYDAKMTDSPGIRERRAKKSLAKEWWKKHEAEVREKGPLPPQSPPK